MSGNSEGGKKAVETIKALYGDDFYARIGSIGGTRSTTGGFAANKERASEAGRKGGKAGSSKHIYLSLTPNKYWKIRGYQITHSVAETSAKLNVPMGVVRAVWGSTDEEHYEKKMLQWRKKR